MAVVSGLTFRFVMKKIYGESLDKKAKPDFSPKKMSRDVFVHNISNVVFNSTANIIVSLFSLSAVTVYSNYNLIVSQVILITQGITNGATASIGIKLANTDKNVYDVFREIFSAILCFGCIICSVFVVMINDFVKLWVGVEYCVAWYNKLMFGIILYCGIIFQGIIVARDAKGLYKESRNFTILQAIVNLVISGLLVPFCGVTGVLLGTIIARVVITIPMNYRLLYKNIFTDKRARYYELPASVCLSLVLIVICEYFFKSILFQGLNSITGFLIKTIISTGIVSFVAILYYSLTDSGFKRCMQRVVSLVTQKIKN